MPSMLSAGSVCASVCCDDTDCPSGAVCFGSSSGVRACVPTMRAGRNRGDAGMSCMLDSECSSGLCMAGMCVATCTSDADCPGAVCHLNVTAPNLGAGAAPFVCGAPAGRGDPGDLCTSFDPTACKSALCTGTQCVSPCGKDADCSGGLVCRYMAISGYLGTGRLSACVQPDQVRAGPGPACCNNADCSSGEACLPMGSGTERGMYCGTAAVVQ